MTNKEAIEFIKNIIGEESGRCIGKEGFYAELIGYHIEALKMAIQALSQEPCEKQIKIGTKVRTTKDKDFACEKVFPVGTIGIVERIDKGDNLPYKIVANNDYWYYSRDMFEIIEDVEPCEDYEDDGWIDDEYGRSIRLEQNKTEVIPPLEPCENCGYAEGSPFCLQYCPYDVERKKEQKPCDDVVSRADRLLDLANAIESDESGYWTNKRISSALRNIKNLPPVTQKSGKWMYVREDRYTCSKCGTITSVDEGGIDEKPMYKFCPYCGARMESEE